LLKQKRLRIPVILQLSPGQLVRLNLFSIVIRIRMGSAITVAGRREAALPGERRVLNQEPPFEAETLDEAKVMATALDVAIGWDEVVLGVNPFKHNHSSKRKDQQYALARQSITYRFMDEAFSMRQALRLGASCKEYSVQSNDFPNFFNTSGKCLPIPQILELVN
jgi:hypothetical protein